MGGCCATSAPAAGEPGDGPTRGSSVASVISTASELSSGDSLKAHRRLKKLRELDKTTKIPFILVELRGESSGNGYVEICGKDEYGVYASLEEWLTQVWGCKKLDSGCLDPKTPLPFSDQLYDWKGFKTKGHSGMSNMGLATMQLVEFMTNQLSWTLGVINGGNVGAKGEIREQQIIFKQPHPMNLVSPLCMVELRSAGCIEVCGTKCGILEDLDAYFTQHFGAKTENGHAEFCDRFYRCKPGIFKEQGNLGENNVGLLTTKVCDHIGNLPGWNLVTMNGGNYGEGGTHREQQLVFRWDNHPLQAQPHVLVEIRGSGHVEVNGTDVDDIYNRLDQWLKSTWKCADSACSGERLQDRKYKWNPIDMMSATADLVAFFHGLGWQMQVCSQGTVTVAGTTDCREQQVLFRPGMSGAGIIEPHLFIELHMGEGKEELYAQPEKTQVLANQHIRMKPIGECGDHMQQFNQFLIDYLGGEAVGDKYAVDCFLSRGMTDNNLGCWTMRVCDFMVDRLGWSFVVCNVCNLGDFGQIREQQLVFRFDGERREIPIADLSILQTDPKSFTDVKLPNYWKIPEIVQHETCQEMVPCEQNECDALQDMMDTTFRRILTRDRVYEYQATTTEEMPYRLEVVHAFRSENLPLLQRFQKRKARYKASGSLVAVKTHEGAQVLNARLGQGEALLFHGTNPSSAISILKTGFELKNAGKSTGTMFGYGVYLAECSSKSDEYSRDDGGGTFPGLRAILVCRCLVGNPYIVHAAGDHIAEAQSDGCDCVLGDRETKVNTYREFVFFDEAQVVPEYAVIYKRQYQADAVPATMRKKSMGTTGRNWQVKLDNRWADVPPDVSRQLAIAMKDGQTSVEIEIGNFMYVFDLIAKTQVNTSTGTSRQLRPPMTTMDVDDFKPGVQAK